MAQVVLANNELVKLMANFIQLTDRISQISAEGSKIKFKIKTPGILPSVWVAIEFQEFYRGLAYFKLEANPLVKLIIEYFDVPDMEWLKIESSQISVDVNHVLKEREPNLSVTNIQQSAVGQFLVDLEIE